MQNFQRHLTTISRSFYIKTLNKQIFERIHLRRELSVSHRSLPLSSALKFQQHSSRSNKHNKSFAAPLLAFGIVMANCARKEEDDDKKNLLYGIYSIKDIILIDNEFQFFIVMRRPPIV